MFIPVLIYVCSDAYTVIYTWGGSHAFNFEIFCYICLPEFFTASFSEKGPLRYNSGYTVIGLVKIFHILSSCRNFKRKFQNRFIKSVLNVLNVIC